MYYSAMFYPGNSVWDSPDSLNRLLKEIKPVFLSSEVVQIIESVDNLYVEENMMKAIVIWESLGKIDDNKFPLDEHQTKFEKIQEVLLKLHADYQQLILSEEIERSEIFDREFTTAMCESEKSKVARPVPFLLRSEYLRVAFEERNEEIAGEVLYKTLKYGTQGPNAHDNSFCSRSKEKFNAIKGNILGRRKGQMEYFIGKQEEGKLLEKACLLAGKDVEAQLSGFQEIIQQIYSKEHKSPYHPFYFYDFYREYLSYLSGESRRQLLEAIIRYGTEGIRGLYDIEDELAKVAFTGIKPSITASQKRYYKAKRTGRSGGRPERFPKKLFVMMATRGFCTTEEMADFLGCSLKTVERKINNDEIDRLQLERLERLKARKARNPKWRAYMIEYYGWNSDDQYEGRTCVITRDPRMIPLLRNTGKEQFKDLDENNIPPNPEF